MPVKLERLKQRLGEMADIGKVQQDGTSSLSLMNEEIEARVLFMKWVGEVGGKVRIDDSGNIHARIEGSNPDKAPIVLGSHLERKTGTFCDALSMLAGLEVLESLKEEVELSQPFEVVLFMNETETPYPAMVPRETVPGIFSKGLDQPVRIDFHRKKAVEEVEAFISLHIGPKPVPGEAAPFDIVTSVQGTSWHSVEFISLPGRKGMVPVSSRKDPLVTAVKAVKRIKQWISGLEDETIVTFGKIHKVPGATDRSPCSITFSLDVKHPVEAVLRQRMVHVEEIIRNVAEEDAVESVWEDVSFLPPVAFSETLISLVKESYNDRGIDYRESVGSSIHDTYIWNQMDKTVVVSASILSGEYKKKEDWCDIEKTVVVIEDTVKKIMRCL